MRRTAQLVNSVNPLVKPIKVKLPKKVASWDRNSSLYHLKGFTYITPTGARAIKWF